MKGYISENVIYVSKHSLLHNTLRWRLAKPESVFMYLSYEDVISRVLIQLVDEERIWSCCRALHYRGTCRKAYLSNLVMYLVCYESVQGNGQIIYNSVKREAITKALSHDCFDEVFAPCVEGYVNVLGDMWMCARVCVWPGATLVQIMRVEAMFTYCQYGHNTMWPTFGFVCKIRWIFVAVKDIWKCHLKSEGIWVLWRALS